MSEIKKFKFMCPETNSFMKEMNCSEDEARHMALLNDLIYFEVIE